MMEIKTKNKNCDHCKVEKVKKSVVVSVELLKIRVLKYANAVVARALIPQVPMKASIPKPSKKLKAMKWYWFLKKG